MSHDIGSPNPSPPPPRGRPGGGLAPTSKKLACSFSKQESYTATRAWQGGGLEERPAAYPLLASPWEGEGRIEYRWQCHYSDDGISGDANRTAYLRRPGYSVLRFTNDDVLGSDDGVFEILRGVLSSPDIGSNKSLPSPFRSYSGVIANYYLFVLMWVGDYVESNIECFARGLAIWPKSNLCVVNSESNSERSNMSVRDFLSETRMNLYNFKCFGPMGSGEFSIGNITVLIGRNNSGKSSIADALRWLTQPRNSYDKSRHGRSTGETFVEMPHVIQEANLRPVFPQNTSGGEIGINHWQYAQRFIGIGVTVRYREDLTAIGMSGLDLSRLTQTGAHYLQQIAQQIPFPLKGASIVNVSAERDVRPEGASGSVALDSNGNGLTNLIRAFINKDNLPRDQVEIELLRELNLVFLGDANFLRISCREDNNGYWEIFLTEESKGDIRLSQSGSSLKSIFIILSKLRLEPINNSTNFGQCIFVLEEPENNLHPALLRRLLEFLAARADELGFALLIATHSPIAIDWLSRRSDGKVLHVTSDGSNSVVREVSEYMDVKNILDDLDIRASDILQANGIVWVEGPSDRIYLRKWIDLASNGGLVEGVHYSIMFYGGKLLSHLTALPPGEKEVLINTLSINRNVAVLMDSDRHLGGPTASNKIRKPRMHINDTKKRIKDEISSVDGYVWITEGREVENYISDRVLRAISGDSQASIGLYDKIPEYPAMKSFAEDKISIASAAAAEWTAADILSSSDLSSNVTMLAAEIRRWNSMSK